MSGCACVLVVYHSLLLKGSLFGDVLRVLCSQNLCEILVSEKGRDCLLPEKYLSLPTADNSTLASLNSV